MSGFEAAFIKSQVCNWPDPRRLELVIGDLSEGPGELCLLRLTGLAGPVEATLRHRFVDEDGDVGDEVRSAAAGRLREFCTSRQDLRLLPILSCRGDRRHQLEAALARMAGPGGPWTPVRPVPFRRVLPLELVCAQLCARFDRPGAGACAASGGAHLLADLRDNLVMDPSFSMFALVGQLNSCDLHQGAECAYYRCQVAARTILGYFRDRLPPPPQAEAPDIAGAAAAASAFAAAAAAAAAASQSWRPAAWQARSASDPPETPPETADDDPDNYEESVCAPFPRPEEMPMPDQLLLGDPISGGGDAGDSDDSAGGVLVFDQPPPLPQPTPPQPLWPPRQQQQAPDSGFDYISGCSRDIRLADPGFVNDVTPDRPYVHHS